MVGQLVAPWGVGLFEVAVDGQDANVTQAQLSRVVDEARRLRRLSWCVTVVVVSDNPAFLTAFAEGSLKGRLLVWATRLLVITRLSSKGIRLLLTSHWTFSMMNTMVMNTQDASQVLSLLGPQVAQVASWIPAQGLVYITPLPLFPEKFSNFYGARVNVTALPYAPYWMTSGEGNNTKHSGIDYNQLMTLSEVLNFTIHVLPSANWDEVRHCFLWLANILHTDLEVILLIKNYEIYEKEAGSVRPQVLSRVNTKGGSVNGAALSAALECYIFSNSTPVNVTSQVEARRSFIATVVYVVLPNRLEQYDYTHTFDYSPLCFGMAKPTLKPQWQSLYYPLANEVWATILVTTILTCLVILMIDRSKVVIGGHGNVEALAVVQEVVGTLLGQGFTGRLSISRSNPVLVAAWLVFAFIVATAYRGNLTASLTLPKYPPRPETVEQLVKAVDRVLPELHEDVYSEFLLNSIFVVSKTSNIFSNICIDQTHEQNNAVVKGDGGAVGLTDDPAALQLGPEMARLIGQFETSSQPANVDESRRHHEQTDSVQSAFLKDIKSLKAALDKAGNPYNKEGSDLLVLDNREVAEPAVVRFFTKSDSKVFSALGKLMVVGVDVIDGYNDALKIKSSHLGSRQYLELMIAQHFSKIDGSAPLYVGREMIIPATSSWPIPHDAPYKPKLDHYIMAITEVS
ncbi:Ionotropic receptor 93a-like 15 [Homarus americanus]|uniref:Ionotropic receptor 93a-like 15 n=1 Tax=Homarus americanus TaxID=6706 RepID=A0A8J5MSC7_HOMAM|nr:Ionotropic receptor 93a-like 15 [Homarus americanus]